MNLIIGMCFMAAAYVGQTGKLYGPEYIRINDIAKNGNLIIDKYYTVDDSYFDTSSVTSGWFIDMTNIKCPKKEKK